MFRKTEFLPTVIFLSIYRKIGVIRADFFKLEFLYYLLLYSAAAVFFIRQAPCFCLLLMLATRLLPLRRSTLAPPQSAIRCCPSTRSLSGWEKAGFEGRANIAERHTQATADKHSQVPGYLLLSHWWTAGG